MKDVTQIDFANHNYAYFEFQQQYRLLCEEVSKMPPKSFVRLTENPIKKTSAMLKEYRAYIKNADLKKEFDDSILNLLNEVNENRRYIELSKIKNKDIIELIEYNKDYYIYLIKLFNIIGKFGDELSSTFMPTKSDRKKLTRYQNTNTFFEQFTKYKSNTSKALADFSILDFRKNFVYFLAFYYAYYSYIHIDIRNLCETTFGKILNIYLSNNVADYLTSKDHTQKERETIKKIDILMHKGLTCIFSKMTESYADFFIMPKIEKKVFFDYTLI